MTPDEQAQYDTIAALHRELAEAKDSAHYANGVAELAMRDRDAAEAENAKLRAALPEFAGQLSAWKDEHHDCDCPPHSSCGCHELRGIIQQMECYAICDDDFAALAAAQQEPAK